MTVDLKKIGPHDWTARFGEFVGRGQGPLSAVQNLFRLFRKAGSRRRRAPPSTPGEAAGT